MDATHGTNIYHFNLITVLVVDEFGEGILTAWAITNTEDVTLLVEFLRAIEKNTGPISPHWFMSDDAPQYFQHPLTTPIHSNHTHIFHPLHNCHSFFSIYKVSVMYNL